MSKTAIGQITTTQTFQSWLDKTNDIVILLETDVMTASALGDSTTGNATLVGTFTANNVIAHDSLKVNTIMPRSGFTKVSYTAPIEINSSGTISQTVISPAGPRFKYSSGSSTWLTGFEDTINNNFIIDTGANPRRLVLTPTGDLTISGKFIALNGIEVPSPFSITGNVIGDITGTVSDISNHNSDDLAEGSSNLYFTSARARSSISGGTGVTYDNATGVVSIGQDVATTSNVTFNNILTSGNVNVQGQVVAAGDVTAYGSVSDITMKENILPISDALEKVLQLGGYTFNYIGNDNPMTGVIAQEIIGVLPGIVYEHDNPNTKEKVYAVRHGNLVGLLIEAIKELNEKIGK